MRILIAPNSFKNSLDARAAAEAIARGLKLVMPEVHTELLPLTDGGDNLVSTLNRLPHTRLVLAKVTDPLGREIEAAWLRRSETAVIEMAQASGLWRLDPAEYNPLKTSTLGTGMLIREALNAGCREIVIGLGGSATVDGGAGILTALGFGLLDENMRPIALGGLGLLRLAEIVAILSDSRLKKTRFTALVDVDNPLLGDSGAARIFGPQKGADAAAVEVLEKGLRNWADVLNKTFKIQTADLPGAGAAGGAGAVCRAAFNAELISGAEWVAEQFDFKAALARADLVFTGEGRLDSQTAYGKGPAYVARQAQAAGKPVIALGGLVEENLDLSAIGITQCHKIAPPDTPLDVSIKNAAEFLEQKAEQVMQDLVGSGA